MFLELKAARSNGGTIAQRDLSEGRYRQDLWFMWLSRSHRESHDLSLKEDTVRIYGLCGACSPKVEVLGTGDAPREDTLYQL